MGQLFFIIASTSWAEPLQLIPQVFNVFAINTLVAFLFMAVTSIITSMLLHFNDKYQVSQRAQQAIMTFCMWIKSHIITENASCKQQ
jgi:glucose uptake protein GlcU